MPKELTRRFVSAAACEVRLTEAAAAGGAPKVGGYGAVFYDGTPATEYRFEVLDDKGNPKTVVERILATAFDKVLLTDDVRGLFNHNADNILGRSTAGTLTLAKDSRGLAYSIELPASPIGETVRVAVQRRDVTGSSFGFSIDKAGQTWSRLDGGEVLREIREVAELFDVGPVTFPAYAGTAAALRSLGDPEDVAEYLAALSGGDPAAFRKAAAKRAGELRKLALADKA